MVLGFDLWKWKENGRLVEELSRVLLFSVGSKEREG